MRRKRLDRVSVTYKEALEICTNAAPLLMPGAIHLMSKIFGVPVSRIMKQVVICKNYNAIMSDLTKDWDNERVRSDQSNSGDQAREGNGSAEGEGVAAASGDQDS